MVRSAASAAFCVFTSPTNATSSGSMGFARAGRTSRAAAKPRVLNLNGSEIVMVGMHTTHVHREQWCLVPFLVGDTLLDHGAEEWGFGVVTNTVAESPGRRPRGKGGFISSNNDPADKDYPLALPLPLPSIYARSRPRESRSQFKLRQSRRVELKHGVVPRLSPIHPSTRTSPINSYILIAS